MATLPPKVLTNTAKVPLPAQKGLVLTGTNAKDTGSKIAPATPLAKAPAPAAAPKAAAPAATPAAKPGTPKYNPVEYMKQQLQNYAKKLQPDIASSNAKSATTKKDIESKSASSKALQDAIAKSQAQAKSLQPQADNLKKQAAQYQNMQNQYQNAYNSTMAARNRDSQAAADNAKNAVANQRIGGFPFGNRTVAQIWGSNPDKWPAQYRNTYVKNAQAAQQQVVNRYQGSLQNTQNLINQNKNAYNTYNNQYNQVNSQITAANNAVKTAQQGITSNTNATGADNAALQKITQQQQDIDKQIEGFKAQSGPKTDLGANISGSAADSIKAAQDAAKSIAGGLSDTDKGNLQNLLDQQAQKIASTYGGNVDDIKKQLGGAQNFFAPGQAPQQMNADQFKDFMGKAIAQQGPTLTPTRLEAGQVQGGTQQSQQAINQYNQPAEQVQQGQNQANQQAQTNYQQSEAQRQADLDAANKAAQAQFSQEQKDFYQPGQDLNNDVFQNSADFDKFQQGQANAQQTGQPPQQNQQQNPSAQPNAVQPQQQQGQPAPVQNSGGQNQPVQMGKIGQFGPAIRGAVQGQINQGFNNAWQTRGQQPPGQPTQGNQQMMGNVQRSLTPQPPQRGMPNQQGPGQQGNQTQGFGQQPGQRSPQPNQRSAFGNARQPGQGTTGQTFGQTPQQPNVTATGADRTQQVNQRAMQLASNPQQKAATAQAMGLTNRATAVDKGTTAADPYNQQQNVQMKAGQTNPNQTAGMRLPR